MLTPAVQETVEHTGAEALACGTLRRDEGGLRRFLTSLAATWVRGIPVHWSPSPHDTGARRVELPTYAFQHRRYWLEAAPASGAAAPADPPKRRSGKPSTVPTRRPSPRRCARTARTRAPT
ncbi:hypothetical protein H0E86_01150 [Streptomyces sp. SCSIO-PteL053]|nr:hypothetical protein H0E86_01150 [Streptomyces sp. SCSIO-PteL053]